MRRFVKEVNIKATDPLVAMPYNLFALLNKDEKKKFMKDIDICKHYAVQQRKTVLMQPKPLL